tara:strand:+ start:176 stop:913 length:738 start_codon:yes stop_codon:yes gene_type:complete
MYFKNKVCVVIPSFRVRNEIKNVLKKIDKKLVDKIIVIDDFCPEKTGSFVKSLKIKNVSVIFLKKNSGVGGATLIGFSKALKQKFDIIFKIDGDGQHDPANIIDFLKKLKSSNVNFCKGTRFKKDIDRNKIPKFRLFGNIILTFLTRINCRNFRITDVVNGYFGIKSKLLKKVDFNRVSNDFFFEEDLLYHLSFHEKNIHEIPIKTFYFKKSSLIPLKTVLPFLIKHLINFLDRLIHDISKKKNK